MSKQRDSDRRLIAEGARWETWGHSVFCRVGDVDLRIAWSKALAREANRIAREVKRERKEKHK